LFLNRSTSFLKRIVHFYSCLCHKRTFGKVCAGWMQPQTQLPINVTPYYQRSVFHFLIQKPDINLPCFFHLKTAPCLRQETFQSSWSTDRSLTLYLTTSPRHLRLKTPNNPSLFFLATYTSPLKNSVSETWIHLRPWLPEMLERLLQAPSNLSEQAILVETLRQMMPLISLSK
jgi:hypothetical protein